jgi:hypothetical protein
MPITDYESRADRNKRALAQAAALRQQAMQEEMEKGQMVSGHFIAPHWTQQLGPLVNNVLGGITERGAQKDQQQLERDIETGHQEWMGTRPQERTRELPGPTETGEPLTETTTPTRDQQINWASQGMKNPLSKSIAAKYLEDQLIQDPIREDARRFKHIEAEEARQGKLDLLYEQGRNRLNELDLKYASAGEDRGLKAEIEKQRNATKLKVAEIENASRVNAAEIRAKAAGAGKTAKAVPNTIIKTMTEAQQSAAGLGESYTTFDPKYGGVGGYIDKLSGTWNPFSSKDSDAAANWWKNYENQSALVERHSMFGTTLSKGEQAAWGAATIKPGMTTQVIQQNLKMRAELAAKHYNELRKIYARSGYGAIPEAFDEVSESFEMVNPQQQDTPVRPPPQIRQPVAPPQQTAPPYVAPPSGGRQLPGGFTRG